MALLSFLVCTWLAGLAQEPEAEAVAEDGAAVRQAAILNPYFQETEWRVWRDDPTPLENVPSVVREGKEEKTVEVTLAPIDPAARAFPLEPAQAGAEGPYVIYQASAETGVLYAGMWDDVYASWSGLHGYVRSNWRGVDGSKVGVLDQVIDFVDVAKANTIRAGVNFIHQSTTGMAHTITNGYSLPMTTQYERLYFADCLVTSPAHSSFTDQDSERSSDLYIAHVPTLFNSVGSSNSETMAITKMMIVGGYLPPATKLLLKRNGLYPAALLSIWKAALPYEVPYDHELRHRVAYKSVGNRDTYPEKYSAAGINRGDGSLAFHQYDDLAHMSAMIDLARSMNVAPPEAIFEVENVGEGTLRYALKKAAVIVQKEGQDVELNVVTSGCYDLQGLPLTTRWKLLYGNKETSVEADPGDANRFKVRVPWDENLPEGRTALALIANNGRFDSNPAILTIYRQKSELPPNGSGYADYKFPLTHSNQRPVLFHLQDQAVRPGKELRVPLRGFDPEGYPLTFYKRAGEVGEIDGSDFVWRCPRQQNEGVHTVTIIASDGTSGNSYAGQPISIHVGKPEVLAQIDVGRLSGSAPLKLRFSAKASIGRTSKTKFDWFIHPSAEKVDLAVAEASADGREMTHTFQEPGLYTVELHMKGAQEDREAVQIQVGDGPVKKRPAQLRVEGNGVRIQDDDETPNGYDHTDFGGVNTGQSRERTLRIWNTGSSAIKLGSKSPVLIQGAGADAFRVTRKPRAQLDPGESTLLTLAFEAESKGTFHALVLIGPPSTRLKFSIMGTGL